MRPAERVQGFVEAGVLHRYGDVLGRDAPGELDLAGVLLLQLLHEQPEIAGLLHGRLRWILRDRQEEDENRDSHHVVTPVWSSRRTRMTRHSPSRFRSFTRKASRIG